MIDGNIISLGGQDYVVPALSFKQVREHRTTIDQLQSANLAAAGSDEFDSIVTIAHAALSRNYPDLPREKLEDLIDARNVGALLKSAFGTAL